MARGRTDAHIIIVVVKSEPFSLQNLHNIALAPLKLERG